eukprot:2647325-Amphidinium_carterae.1
MQMQHVAKCTQPCKLWSRCRRGAPSRVIRGAELQSLFRGGSLGELSFQLQGESHPEWLGRCIVTFASKAG